MKKILLITLIGTLFLCLSSCERSIYEMEREAKREAAYNDGYEAGYDEGYGEGYGEGYNEAFDHFSWIVNSDAVHYAREYSDWHPEEAMCIIKAYENGELAFGNMQVSEEDYKEAIESLYRYCEYFYYDMYN